MKLTRLFLRYSHAVRRRLQGTPPTRRITLAEVDRVVAEVMESRMDAMLEALFATIRPLPNAIDSDTCTLAEWERHVDALLDERGPAPEPDERAEEP